MIVCVLVHVRLFRSDLWMCVEHNGMRKCAFIRFYFSLSSRGKRIAIKHVTVTDIIGCKLSLEWSLVLRIKREDQIEKLFFSCFIITFQTHYEVWEMKIWMKTIGKWWQSFRQLKMKKEKKKNMKKVIIELKEERNCFITFIDKISSRQKQQKKETKCKFTRKKSCHKLITTLDTII